MIGGGPANAVVAHASVKNIATSNIPVTFAREVGRDPKMILIRYLSFNYKKLLKAVLLVFGLDSLIAHQLIFFISSDLLPFTFTL